MAKSLWKFDERIKFWKQTYLAAIRGGKGTIDAKSMADRAVHQMIEARIQIWNDVPED